MDQGIFRKYYGFEPSATPGLGSSQVRYFLEPERIILGSKWFGTKIPLTSIVSSEGMSYSHITHTFKIQFCANGNPYTLFIDDSDSDTGEHFDGAQIYDYIVDHSGMSAQEKAKARQCKLDYYTTVAWADAE